MKLLNQSPGLRANAYNAELFTNQIPEFPNFGRQGIIPAKPSLSNPIPDMYPQPNQPQGWTLSGFHHLHGTATGRAPGTIWWAGIANLFWWADPERGLGGFIASQILPFAGECIPISYPG